MHCAQHSSVMGLACKRIESLLTARTCAPKCMAPLFTLRLLFTKLKLLVNILMPIACVVRASGERVCSCRKSIDSHRQKAHGILISHGFSCSMFSLLSNSVRRKWKLITGGWPGEGGLCARRTFQLYFIWQFGFGWFLFLPLFGKQLNLIFWANVQVHTMDAQR